MEAPCSRFTAAEGGTRLASAARARNSIVAEHTAFVATRLLHEEAYRIRGSLRDGYQRSVYVTRASLVRYVAYNLTILTDLTVLSEHDIDTDNLSNSELEEKQVLVCTSKVIRQFLERSLLTMDNINVLIIDSCHLICQDQHLKYLMSIYKSSDESKRPRILGLTYPLFTSTRKETAHEFTPDTVDNVDKIDKVDTADTVDKVDEVDEIDNLDPNNKLDTTDASLTNREGTKTHDLSESITDDVTEKEEDHTSLNEKILKSAKINVKMGDYQNYDDFKMYEKLEWKLDELEKELCSSADLAEDVDGVKRIAVAISKPKELIIEFAGRPDSSALPKNYVELENYMRDTVIGAIDFLNDHRYDPTEIYGEEMYEEFKNIPDPTIEPKQIFTQFLYVLDQLGPYGADKAAFSLLTKLEKLKIKVPYERHFLLLCLCTSVLVQVRCHADAMFAPYENDWLKIREFSTPKVLRFVEILTKFKPPNAPVESETLAKTSSDNKTSLDSNKLLSVIENLDFKTLGDKIEDTVNAYEANLKDLDVKDKEKIEKEKKEDGVVAESEKSESKDDKGFVQSSTGIVQEIRGFSRRLGHRARGRGRVQRSNAIRQQQMHLNPDALCGIVFMREPLMAKILFMIIVELSRHHPDLTFLCTQYSAIEKPADPVQEPKEFEKQRKKQEEVLKKFRMHECNLLLATSALEEGIDLPRCNLVLRWDMPASYRSHALCRGRARAPRSACALLSPAAGGRTGELLLNLATYKELDQIVSRKCGCGIQNEPPQSEEDHADGFTPLIAPYTPMSVKKRRMEGSEINQNETNKTETTSTSSSKCNQSNENCGNPNESGFCNRKVVTLDTSNQVVTNDPGGESGDQIVSCNQAIAIDPGGDCDKVVTDESGAESGVKVVTVETEDKNNVVAVNSAMEISDIADKSDSRNKSGGIVVTVDPSAKKSENIATGLEKVVSTESASEISCQVGASESSRKKSDVAGTSEKKSEEPVASVDLSTAIALINRYCGKLPSDTFTRLAPQWWTEEVTLPLRARPGDTRTAYVCTMRLPLNCPVKYNIVGHPMPTRVLARRMVALQACRILHKSGELDNQLMPIGKDNFKAAELEVSSANNPAEASADPNDLARPGTTKRRQYYYKRTARAFTDCQPIVDTSDSEIDPPAAETKKTWGQDNDDDDKAAGSQNVLYAIVYTLQCALPERYNTRGRRLHAPQNAAQALALLTKQTKHPFAIPAFPVYTRSGEVSVSLVRAVGADVRVCARRARLVRAFMRFVFGRVLRVRRRGMRLPSEPARPNNYYVVPTVKSVRQNGTTKIDIDWGFLEVIYKHTEEKKLTELEKPLFWNQDEEESEEPKKPDEVKKTKEENTAVANAVSEIVPKSENTRPTEEITKSDKVNANNTCDNSSSDKTLSDNGPSDKSSDEATKKCNGASLITFQSQSEILKTEIKGASTEKGKVKKMANPLLKPGETFVFDAEKYKEAVVTPWYRNQDQPQYFLVAEICWNLTPDSAFPSATHTTFRSYYETKYGVTLTQADQPLLDVDHTSARLNLLTPRYVNRKGVALPVSSERTRRAKRDRLDQKQILVPELCRVHPFAAPLWFATVALPCVLYRINALLIADEIRQAVAVDVGLGIPRINEDTCPGFQWPPLDFGWSLAEVLNTDTEKSERKKPEDDQAANRESSIETRPAEDEGPPRDKLTDDSCRDNASPKTINDILQEKEDAQSGFEIGTWSNEMAASIPETVEYDELLDPLPSNLTFCTSASGGTNWCDPVQKRPSSFHPSRAFSVADSDCSYMSSDFDTDDSDLNSEGSDEDTDTSGFWSGKTSSAAMGVRIEYKTAHEAEAVDLERSKRIALAPQPDEEDDARDRREQDRYLRSGDAPAEYKERYYEAISSHKQEIYDKHLLIHHDQTIDKLLPETGKPPSLEGQNGERKSADAKLLDEIFPYGTEDMDDVVLNGQVTLENIEKCKRQLLNYVRQTQPAEVLKKLNCFSMKDVDIDSPDYVNEKLANIGFASVDSYMERVKVNTAKRDFVPYYEDVTVSNSLKEFDFDYQPNLEGHPGPSPSLILQALTMSNANDGINLERLETIGDSFLKFAITAYLYCAHPTVHEGKLSHMRSKQVSNLNLYRLGRNKRLGARMIASKFEPHDNWLPPCHKPPATLDVRPNLEHNDRPEHSSGEGCFIPYNLITQHSIPDKSIADCVEALIGAYLLSCGGRGALLFMSWLGLRVLPRYEVPHDPPTFTKLHPSPSPPPAARPRDVIESDSNSSDDEEEPPQELPDEDEDAVEWSWERRVIGSLKPYKDEQGFWRQSVFGELKAPPSPLLRYIDDPEGELEQMLSGYDALERTLQYRFRDRSLLLQAMTHASHQTNRLTDCYQRLEFLGDAILDYLITRHLYEDSRRHSPGALTDLRSALVNNTIFATLAVRHGFHKYFRHMSPGLNDVLTKYVKIQEENGHSISEEHYLIQEDEMEQAEDVEVPKALGDLFESVAGAIFLDSGMSLGAVWRSYVSLMGAELEAFSAAAPKSPVRELLEAEPDTAKFGKPERLADGRRVRVCVEVFGRGAFKGIGRNYRIAKGTAARCALRHLKKHRGH